MTTEATGGRPPAQDPRDDWLADSNADDLEWFPPAGGGDVRGPGRIVPRRQPQRAGRGTGPIPAGPPEFLRGRGMLLAVLALVVVVIVIAVVAFGGGGGSSTPPVTTPVTPPGSTTTTPPTTTPSTTTTKKTPGTSTTTKKPAVTVTLPATGYLKPGDTGAAVVTLQKALVALKVASLTSDGNYGPATETAVAAFQRAHGLTADGVVGAKTAAAINAALRAAA